MNKKVYLAGPIAGLSFNNAVDWREYAVRELAARGLLGYSPMRGKEYLNGLTTIPGGGADLAGDLTKSQAIVCRDFYDVQTSDVVIFNLLGAKTVSIGTMMEMAWAYALRVPAILIMEKEGNPHEHWFVRQVCGIQTDDLRKAFALAAHVVLP